MGFIKKKIIYGCESRGDFDKPYLTRYIILNLKNVQLCLHIFHRSDADDLHDHPWSFISLLLWRGYNEQTPEGKSRKYPGMILYRKANHLHRVELVNGKKAVSLVIMGKRKRAWGFTTSKGWVYWETYFKNMGC
ncbi:MAG TPA: hypothetical protein VFM69_15800 [Pricia sp.]|nr:hypothetical protein [Pricia sp.]